MRAPRCDELAEAMPGGARAHRDNARLGVHRGDPAHVLLGVVAVAMLCETEQRRGACGDYYRIGVARPGADALEGEPPALTRNVYYAEDRATGSASAQRLRDRAAAEIPPAARIRRRDARAADRLSLGRAPRQHQAGAGAKHRRKAHERAELWCSGTMPFHAFVWRSEEHT